MALELIAEDGVVRQHRQRLQELLDATAGPVRIASAYVTDHELLFGVSKRKVRLLTSLVRMDIVSGATSLKSLRTLLDAGVHCRSLSDGPRLHAKVYVLGEEFAVVTSANLTRSALDSNIEVGVCLSGGAVRQLADWFDTFWAKARRVDQAKVSKWEQETETLRQEYARLRKKAGAGPRLPNEATPSVPSPARLRDLVDNAPRFFVCNTNRRYSPDGKDEELMRRSGYAAVWTDFKYPKHMERVRPGDAIFSLRRA
jgi:phospholipase D-like protein